MAVHSQPWRHDSELAMVRDWFYPDHAKHDAFSAPPEDMRQRAVDRVNLWLFKAGRLPAAVVSTASLTEALIHDNGVAHQEDRHGCGDGPGRRNVSEPALQSIYAMAFARFVNGFVDRDVARSQAAALALDDSRGPGATTVTTSSLAGQSASSTGRGESSMYAHAVTIGMPEVFVDLRHQVTHGDLPGLYYLRKMALQALQWLYQRWWVKHAQASPARALREQAERHQLCLEMKARRDVDERQDVEFSVDGVAERHSAMMQSNVLPLEDVGSFPTSSHKRKRDG
ncbi:hypothetical protein PV10_04506 [Exophiala mesophila]|uniref:Las1-like protein n=1 Tax=Exophiala mesophila TaxID=212818 RepID=A0A0D1WVA9_EXOME|nr:uncharacterized protein PV10_04506 [Exophiala mesophila]KIV93280.1 hypothetical protein PV10_04506 [Exophiala mesophila]